jgi:uncharacterized protein affecting Mg2+/Co2+ transport
MGLESIDKESLFLILGFLPPRDIPSVSLLNRYFRDFIREHESIVWKSTLKYSFGVELGNHPCQWSGAFPDVEDSRVPERDLALTFHGICLKYGSVGYRMIRIWDGIYTWAQEHASPLKATLLPGIPLERLDLCDQLVKRQSHGAYGMPIELASMYSLCGGQRFARLKTPSGDPFELGSGMWEDEFPEGLRLEFSDSPGSVQLQGLFGGMKVYHDEFSLALIPFETMIYCSIFRQLSRPSFLIALNLYGVRYKHMYFEQTTGQLQFDPKPGMSHGIDCVAHSRRLYAPGKPLPSWYVPSEDQIQLISHHFPETEGRVQEMGYSVYPIVSMIHWFESYMMQLQRGNFQYKYIPDLGERIIWKFPALPPQCSEITTHGISVKASCVLAPHAVQNPSLALVWAYNISFKLLSIEKQAEMYGTSALQGFGGPLESVQLRRRHWKIISLNGTDQVDGEGVVGDFPVLHQGGDEYSYSSYTSIETQSHYTHQNTPVDGMMQGYFTFEECEKEQPRRIQAVCPCMHLHFPDIVY